MLSRTNNRGSPLNVERHFSDKLYSVLFGDVETFGLEYGILSYSSLHVPESISESIMTAVAGQHRTAYLAQIVLCHQKKKK